MILWLLLLFINVDGYGWYPLLDIKSFNTKKINEIKILDKNIVIWEKNEKLIVQDNICIHRGGPLSEGYIDLQSKNLRCSYHGWEFDSKGNVKSIPQYQMCNKCDKETTASEFKKTSKFNQKTYQTELCNNILWINLNDNITCFPDHIKNYNMSVSHDITVVEVPYTMNILLENLFDPAHVPFAHHTLQSSRELASSVNCSVVNMNSSSLEIYFEDNTLKNNEYRNGTMSFNNPSHYMLNSLYPDVFIKRLHVYCVPIFPHKTRIFVQNEYKDEKFKRIYSLVPTWFKHVITQSFFDSDTMLLYKQEKQLRERNSLYNCTNTYVTPTSSDKPIYFYHKWKNKYPTIWSIDINSDNTQFPDLSRKEVFDRYNGHTKNCKSCMNILNNINLMQKIIPFLFVYGIANSNVNELLISIIIYYLLNEFKTYFISRDYVHNNL